MRLILILVFSFVSAFSYQYNDVINTSDCSDGTSTNYKVTYRNEINTVCYHLLYPNSVSESDYSQDSITYNYNSDGSSATSSQHLAFRISGTPDCMYYSYSLVYVNSSCCEGYESVNGTCKAPLSNLDMNNIEFFPDGNGGFWAVLSPDEYFYVDSSGFIDNAQSSVIPQDILFMEYMPDNGGALIYNNDGTYTYYDPVKGNYSVYDNVSGELVDVYKYGTQGEFESYLASLSSEEKSAMALSPAIVSAGVVISAAGIALAPATFGIAAGAGAVYWSTINSLMSDRSFNPDEPISEDNKPVTSIDIDSLLTSTSPNSSVSSTMPDGSTATISSDLNTYTLSSTSSDGSTNTVYKVDKSQTADNYEVSKTTINKVDNTVVRETQVVSPTGVTTSNVSTGTYDKSTNKEIYTNETTTTVIDTSTGTTQSIDKSTGSYTTVNPYTGTTSVYDSSTGKETTTVTSDGGGTTTIQKDYTNNTTTTTVTSSTGLTSTTVKNGTDGASGINGVNGIDGANGTNGTNGTNRTNGTNGADGQSVTPCLLVMDGLELLLVVFVPLLQTILLMVLL